MFYLELAVIGPEESVQTAVLHVLGDDHDRGGLSHHALEEDGVTELGHDGGSLCISFSKALLLLVRKLSKCVLHQ